MTDHNVLRFGGRCTVSATGLSHDEACPVVVVRDTSNRDFLLKYALAGLIGLAGGSSAADRLICMAERHIHQGSRWGSWSHAFFLQGERADGHHWVIESDLEIHQKHVRLGVQENRLGKFFKEKEYPSLALLDFHLGSKEVRNVLKEGLELVAGRTRYSIRELLGTLIALRHPRLRTQKNLLASERSFYCSSFVRHLFSKAGMDLLPGLETKNTTPEDLLLTPVPHTSYILLREAETKSTGLLRTALARYRKGL